MVTAVFGGFEIEALFLRLSALHQAILLQTLEPGLVDPAADYSRLHSFHCPSAIRQRSGCGSGSGRLQIHRSPTNALYWKSHLASQLGLMVFPGQTLLRRPE